MRMSNACIECAMADCDISAADQHTQQGTQRNRLRTLMRSTMDDVLRLSSSRSRCPKRRSRAQKKSHLRLILPSRLRQRFDDTEFLYRLYISADQKNWYPMYNLHVHNKNLKRGLSDKLEMEKHLPNIL